MGFVSKMAEVLARVGAQRNMAEPSPHLAQIWVYPIKSLDGVSVTQATVLPSGALQYDREFAIADASGKFVNGKRYPQIHQIRATFDLGDRRVTLWQADQLEPVNFHLDGDRHALGQWLSDFFQFPVQVIQNTTTGYPDDLKSPGPTVVSLATLETVVSWFPQLTLDELRRRLRTNLEIANVMPFWEDQLLGETEQGIPFQIGDVTFLGINPCQRCVVPTRNSYTGIADPQFQQRFTHQRQQTLPKGVVKNRFNHYYRLCLNTRIADPLGVQCLHVHQAVQRWV